MISHHRGHKIEFVGGVWRFVDTGEVARKGRQECGHCGKYPTIEGHDGCLGTLPGVKNACCGHGQVSNAYVQLWDGNHLGGQDAIDFIKKVRDTAKSKN